MAMALLHFLQKTQAASSSFNIKVIADISCDIGCPIPSTLRASTIAEPVYGYHKINGTETDFNHLMLLQLWL